MRAMIQEIVTGKEFYKAQERAAEQLAAKEAQAYRGGKWNSMKFVGTIPAEDYFTIRQFQGDDCWNDRAFVRDYFKKFPHLKAANI